MAYNDSGELPISQSTYSLGEYTFNLTVQTVHEPGEEKVVSAFARCTGPDGARETQALDFPTGTTIDSWFVEANETEASVYAHVADSGSGLNFATIPCDTANRTMHGSPYWTGQIISTDTMPTLKQNWHLGAADHPCTLYVTYYKGAHTLYVALKEPDSMLGHRIQHTYGGGTLGFCSLRKTFQVCQPDQSWQFTYYVPESTINPDGKLPIPSAAPGDYLVGRFTIDIREADGGPDGDWDEPGDTGDPSYTLNVYVTGASSGSNNGTPLEPGQTGGYGNGGTGGNGGGGGAGASTVIIYDFATDKAGTVNQEATAQGPGTGGPGGKGGKGGDGCILIFY